MTTAGLREWLELLAEADATIPARHVLDRLPAAPATEPEEPPPAARLFTELSWRERLWLCPTETRFGIHELCEALGRSSSWVYRHTSPRALSKSDAAPIPHRKLEGELVFLAGELRTWLRETEASVHELPHTQTPAEMALLKLVEGERREAGK